MVSLLASLALVLALEPAVPVTADVVGAQDPVVVEEPSATGDEVLASETSPTNGTEAVPICILTFCPERGTRCDYLGVDPIRNCCQYDCYSDSSCTTKQNPPNVCKKNRL